jgi:hypothetical protein
MVSAPGVVGWWCLVLTTWHHVGRLFCRCKEGCIGGLFAHPSSTFLRRHGNRTLPECSVLVWRCGGCGAGTILVAVFTAAARRTMCYRCNAFITHRALTSYLVFKKIRYSSFNNIDLLCSMLADCCVPRCREWGTMTAVRRRRPPWFIGVRCACFT